MCRWIYFLLQTNTSLINSISVTPGFGDHFAVLADSSLKPEVHKKPPRKIFQYGKAKMAELKSDLDAFVNTSLVSIQVQLKKTGWASKLSCLIRWTNTFRVKWARQDAMSPGLTEISTKWDANSKDSITAPKSQVESTERTTTKPSAKQRITTSEICSAKKMRTTRKPFRYIKNLRRDNSGISPLKVDGRTISDP